MTAWTVLLLGAVAASACATRGSGHSALWGLAGESWTSYSRLPDFSRAGYRSGYQSIPEVAVVANVRDFGAVGDGVTDDSHAFLSAIAQTEKGAILIPPGRYVITAVLRIDKSGIVLRGAGPALTTLVIPEPLQRLDPVDVNEAGQLPYAFEGAFVSVEGSVGGAHVAKVVALAMRGDTELRVDDTRDIEAGDWIRLLIRSSPSVGGELHGGLAPGAASLRRHFFIDTVFRVEGVGDGVIELDRPLRTVVRPESSPELRSYRPSVSEVGIEGMAFEFPGTDKPEHFLEEGFNAIQIIGAANSWVRNVTVIDADMGIKVVRARFCQIEGVRFLEKRRKGETGHHGIYASGDTQECLFSDFEFRTTYIHDISVDWFAHGNVFRKGQGVAINFDHHRNGPYENLFTDIHAGSGHRLWTSGGRRDSGPHSGARTTLWNVRYEGSLGELPAKSDFPLVNIVGVRGYREGSDPEGFWIEALGRADPEDLFEAQRARRPGARR